MRDISSKECIEHHARIAPGRSLLWMPHIHLTTDSVAFYTVLALDIRRPAFRRARKRRNEGAAFVRGTSSSRTLSDCRIIEELFSRNNVPMLTSVSETDASDDVKRSYGLKH